MEDAALLDLWEDCARARPIDRALLLLHGLAGDGGGEDPAGLPIGLRDARLLHERMARFGHGGEAVVDCPACHERMAFPLDLAALADAAPPAPPDAVVDCAGGRYRLPTSRDLAAAVALPVPREALARLCRIEGDGPLDDAALDALDDAFAAADPAAAIDLALACAACGHAFTAPFDAAEALWTDLSRHAARTLDEVHRLASAYGWSEAQVLAVPPARRSWYLQRVSG
jgi:hypothetical protein